MKRTDKIKGLVSAPLNGFKEDGSVDLEIIADYADFLHRNGVKGVFVNGTTGEGYSLGLSERKRVAERWVETSPVDLKIIIHVSCLNILETKELISHAFEIGAGAAGIMGPLFYKPENVQQLVDYVGDVARTSPDLPIYYYHIPAMSGITFPMIDFLKAANDTIPNLRGIKYTDEDLDDAQECRGFASGKYDILHGRDEILLKGLIQGTGGAVGSLYNLIAPLFNEIIEKFEKGDMGEAEELQKKACEIIQILSDTGSFFGACKTAIRQLGIDIQGIRMPLHDLTGEQKKGLKQKLSEISFYEYANRS